MARLAKSEEQRQRDVFVRSTAMLMAGRGVTKRDLANYIGVSYPTMIGRFKNPDTFQFGEMQGIAKMLNIKLENLMEGKIASEC